MFKDLRRHQQGDLQVYMASLSVYAVAFDRTTEEMRLSCGCHLGQPGDPSRTLVCNF